MVQITNEQAWKMDYLGNSWNKRRGRKRVDDTKVPIMCVA